MSENQTKNNHAFILLVVINIVITLTTSTYTILEKNRRIEILNLEVDYLQERVNFCEYNHLVKVPPVEVRSKK